MLLPSRVAGRTLDLRGPDLARGPEVARLWSNGTPIVFSNASNPPKTTILAEFVGTKQRWSCYPAGVKIRPSSLILVGR